VKWWKLRWFWFKWQHHKLVEELREFASKNNAP
jgi:hypothetical protein